MSKGRTGYEILRDWASGLFGQQQAAATATASASENPLGAAPGTRARLSNLVEYENDLWVVTEIWRWKREINQSNHPMTDYILESEDRRLVLRCVPRIMKGKPTEPDLLLLNQYWPDMPGSDGPYPWGEFSEEILDAIQDPTAQFYRNVGQPDEEVYFRQLANIHCRVGRESATRGGTGGPYTLWAFNRMTKDEGGTEFEQHLQAQLSGHFFGNKQIEGGDKTILMLRGQLVPTMNVMLY